MAYQQVKTKYEVRKGDTAYWGSDMMPYTMEILRDMESAGYRLYCDGKRVQLSSFKEAVPGNKSSRSKRTKEVTR